MCIFTKKFRTFDRHLPIVQDKVLKKTLFFLHLSLSHFFSKHRARLSEALAACRPDKKMQHSLATVKMGQNGVKRVKDWSNAKNNHKKIGPKRPKIITKTSKQAAQPSEDLDAKRRNMHRQQPEKIHPTMYQVCACILLLQYFKHMNKYN